MALKSISYQNKTFDIAYDIVNPTAKKDIVFLHGWGSNKEIMKMAFSHYLKAFRHIYIDMPGFGKSMNSSVLTTQEYASIIEAFLLQIDSDKKSLSIAGHSYGGKVATLLNPKNLILLSSAGILEKKSCKVRMKIKLAKLLNVLGLGKITRRFRSKDVQAMSQNMYETFKNVVNEDFSTAFENYTGNAYIFWGEQDTATSLASGQKIASLIKNSAFTSYRGDHYFFCEHANDITQRLENAIL
ncbi:MAG: alpha/beta fold hydrolase [Candidatus Marinarcus sp.]|uniref:alpha/beta fold hydrolase n=1 Tax=Candidatus Marinarcus sp. TaxID=3100987 RepID=UPI003AFFF98D